MNLSFPTSEDSKMTKGDRILSSKDNNLLIKLILFLIQSAIGGLGAAGGSLKKRLVEK